MRYNITIKLTVNVHTLMLLLATSNDVTSVEATSRPVANTDQQHLVIIQILYLPMINSITQKY
jgi:hypothetical protein